MFTLKLTNRLEEIERLPAFIQEICGSCGIDDMSADMINLALEELVVNVINYAYPEGESGDIVINSEFLAPTLSISISDKGKPFDPTAAEDADISLSVEDRPIGGLGIHLAKNIMDELKYERREDTNILTMIKNI